MMDFKKVPALMSNREIKLLYEISKVTEGDVVEVGSWKGGSTIVIASGLKNGKVYAIDPHKNTTAHKANLLEDTFKDFMENINNFGVRNKVIPIRKTSKEAFEVWDGKEMGMMYIDGNHEYEHAKYDIEHWWKFLKRGGFLVIHDFAINGDVADVVLDCVVDKAKLVKRVDSLVVFINEGKSSILDKINLKIYKMLREYAHKNGESWLLKFVSKIWSRMEILKDTFTDFN